MRVIDLSGVWSFGYDKSSVNESIVLPGTTDEHKKGEENLVCHTDHLSRKYIYSGPAWYQKTVDIPENAEGKHIELFLERTRLCTVYIDDVMIGQQDSHSTAIRFSLGYLNAGVHKISICVNNSEDATLFKGHSNSEHTQTNWNGILGRIELRVTNPIRIDHMNVVPNLSSKTVSVCATIINDTSVSQEKNITLKAKSFNSKIVDESPHFEQSIKIPPQRSEHEFTLDMGESCLFWSEFSPNLYCLSAILDENVVSVDFAMRDFSVSGTQFIINDCKTFLRGKHDACVFPFTGYAPMDLDSWLHYMGTISDYGINHVRFHSWCPPEAAFQAADRKGIYLQPELPNWNVLAQAEKGAVEDVVLDGFGRAENNQFDSRVETEAERVLLKEGLAILKNYGNYASFVMFALGNELAGDVNVMARLVRKYREQFPNKLYAQGSNNHFEQPKLQEGDDYWTTGVAGEHSHFSLDKRVRASFSYCNHASGGAINTLEPNTRYNYSEAIEGLELPVIGHETGQYQFFPDYEEAQRYNGVLEARNYMESQRLMKKNGLYDQWKKFNRATGRFASILYKEDMEQGLRTPGFGGFQLLDLQDFPGQGTALVGILNSFLENKGHITVREWRESCQAVTVLARFDRFTWSEGDEFAANIQVANYGPEEINGAFLEWQVDGLERGCVVDAPFMPQGELTEVGKISFQLPEHSAARQYRIHLNVGEITNSYPFWVYPSKKSSIPDSVSRVSLITPEVLRQIESGGRWLWMPDFKQIENLSLGGLFMTDYWSFSMFKKISEMVGKEVSPGTLGLSIDHEHPALRMFPTEYHSHWQWRNIVIHSRPLRVSHLGLHESHIAQPIDNMWRHEELAFIFEFKIGAGKVFCMSFDETAISDKPEVNTLFTSIYHYMESEEFNPKTTLGTKDFKEWLNGC